MYHLCLLRLHGKVKVLQKSCLSYYFSLLCTDKQYYVVSVLFGLDMDDLGQIVNPA